MQYIRTICAFLSDDQSIGIGSPYTLDDVILHGLVGL